jgi:hypothetical protein
MRIPRWLVVTLLSASVLAVLGAGAWWWITWPERTARKFVAFVIVQNADGVFEINASDKFEAIGLLFKYYERLPKWDQAALIADSATVLELCVGQRHFRISDYGFTVKRGWIIDQGFKGDSVFDLYRQDLFSRYQQELEEKRTLEQQPPAPEP